MFKNSPRSHWVKERIREKQAGECVLAVGRCQEDSQQAHHVWWSREPQKCVHTHTHTHEHWRHQSSQSALPAPTFNFSRHQWKCLCKTEGIMSVILTKITRFKGEKRETEPLLGTRWSWHVWRGTPIENPFFIINEFCATERLDYRSIITT